MSPTLLNDMEQSMLEATRKLEVGDMFTVRGVDYGPKGLQLVVRQKDLIVVRSFGHRAWAQLGMQQYYPGRYYVFSKAHGFIGDFALGELPKPPWRKKS